MPAQGRVRWPLVHGEEEEDEEDGVGGGGEEEKWRFRGCLAIQSQRMFPRHDQRPREVNKADEGEGRAVVCRDTHSGEPFCILEAEKLSGV